jgi:glycosyltransferase involved in cell wall biosynthesis
VTKRVCFVSQRYYPGDARLGTEIKSLQDVGYEIHVICMKERNQPRFSVEQDVRIYRVPSLVRQRAGALRYIAEYTSFWIPTFLLLTTFHILRRYRLVHITNLPDILPFTALVPKLLGAKIIFDARECSPEMFAERFGKPMVSNLIGFMIRIEQVCLRFADATVTCTEQMREALIKRGGDASKISVILNTGSEYLQGEPILPDNNAKPETFRLVTHGTIIKRYGHEVLIRAMAVVLKQVPNIHLDIIGRGNLEAELKQLTYELGLQDHITFCGFISEEALLSRLRAAHCGVVPILRNLETDLVHTYKMYEYIQLGIPVIISRTTAVETYFDASSLYLVEAGDVEAMAQAIIDLAADPQKCYDLASNALQLYENYAPAKQRAAYLSVVNPLLYKQLESP